MIDLQKLIMLEVKEISEMTEKLENYIKNYGINETSQKIYKYLYGKEDSNTEEYIRLRHILSNFKLYEEFRLSNRHDLLCFFSKVLELLPIEDIPKRNVYSCTQYREYDPVKNGMNYIKHNLFFNDVVDNSSGNFSEYMIEVYNEELSKDNRRLLIFSRMKIDNELKFIMSVVSQQGLKFRFVSSRTYTEKNFENSIKHAIRHDEISKEQLEEYRKLALQNIAITNGFNK